MIFKADGKLKPCHRLKCKLCSQPIGLAYFRKKNE